jgi:hypothetical protein
LPNQIFLIMGRGRLGIEKLKSKESRKIYGKIAA